MNTANEMDTKILCVLFMICFQFESMPEGCGLNIRLLAKIDGNDLRLESSDLIEIVTNLFNTHPKPF